MATLLGRTMGIGRYYIDVGRFSLSYFPDLAWCWGRMPTGWPGSWHVAVGPVSFSYRPSSEDILDALGVQPHTKETTGT